MVKRRREKPKPDKHFREVPEEVKEEWRRRKIQDALGIKPQIRRIVLGLWDELEVITPQDYYVFGVNDKGKLVVGQTNKSPEFISIMSIYNKREFFIPIGATRKLDFTINNRVQVFVMGDAMLIRPVKEYPKTSLRWCSECKRDLTKVPFNYKMSAMKLYGKEYYFCSITCRMKFRKKWGFKEARGSFKLVKEVFSPERKV